MREKKKCGKRIAGFTAGLFAVLGIVLCVVLLQQKAEERHIADTQETKWQELEATAGSYSEQTILLTDVTPAQAQQLADMIQAKLRMDSNGNFGVLYLPENVTLADIYKDETLAPYLSYMNLDYYTELQDMDALGRELLDVRPTYGVSDPLYGQQTYLDYLNLQDTWAITRGAGVAVAVIDTGIDTDHPDFAGRISQRSYNAAEDKIVSDYDWSVIEDEEGHGTTVAGVIAAGMNNGVGITGLAPEVELIVIKCETAIGCPGPRISDVLFGLSYAIECDVDVVNMSFTFKENETHALTRLAADSDIICVASAGNDGSLLPAYPAADEYVIGVGAMEKNGWTLASYSNSGFSTILAPGTVLTTQMGGGYGTATGTSLSAPVVTAAVALYRAQNPNAEFAEVEAMLKASGRDLGVPGMDREYAFGVLDIHALVCEEKGVISYEMLTDEIKPQTQYFVRGHNVQEMPEPERNNVVWDGWYRDIHCTDECQYYTDIFNEDTTLYASWINEDESLVYQYSTLSDGTIEIRSYTGRRRYLSVPAQIDGKTVSGIGQYAFSGNQRIRTVYLPDSVTYIAEHAFFNCGKLREIEIPAKVKTIGRNAFMGCSFMTRVSLLSTGSLTHVENGAFSMCPIASIHLPASLTDLHSRAFFGCSVLQSITVAAENPAYQVINKALYDKSGTKLLLYPAGLGGEYAVNAGTLMLEEGAFAYTNCTSVTLNEGLQALGEDAFTYSRIMQISLPASLQTMGENCFAGSYLREVHFTEEDGLTAIPTGAFQSCWYLTEIEIPRQITDIGKMAFYHCGLQKITFESGSNLRSIAELAFYNNHLTEIQIPASVVTIGDIAFGECRNLQTVTFEPGTKLQSIGGEAFEKCVALRQVTLPDSLSVLGERSFFGSGLESVVVGKNVTQLGNGAFADCQNLQSIVVEKGNAAYVSVDGVVYNADKTVVCAYPAGSGDTSYKLPSTVTYVADMAFHSARNLQMVTFNEGLTELGDSAFSDCTALTTPKLPSTLQTIGTFAFGNCEAMSGTLLLPKNVIHVGYYAFGGADRLNQIVVEAESLLSRIGEGAFANCGIEDFTVPGNVATMGMNVFSGCHNLITVTFEADSQLEHLAAGTFNGADNLRQITFEEGSMLTTIEAYSCQGLQQLQRVTLENCTKLETIDNYAFAGCSALSHVTLPDSLRTIGRYAFRGCTSLKELTLPAGIAEIGRYAFSETGVSLYFTSPVLPANLAENWDYGVAAYYTHADEVYTSGDWQYALSAGGKASIIAYTGQESSVVLGKLDGHEVVSIGGSAFADNQTLRSIVLPDTLQGIYRYAFRNTTALQSVEIPAAVAVIENGAFQNSGISAVTFAEGSRLSGLGQYAFADTPNLRHVDIPAGVKTIGAYAFQNSGLQTVTFAQDAALTEISRGVFESSALQRMELPDSVTKIDYGAFRNCKELAEVDLGASADLQIFAEAFYGSGLRRMEIPTGVSYIGEFCFTGCLALEEIAVAQDNEFYADDEGVLYNKAMTRLLACPAGKTGTYTVGSTVSAMGFAAFEDSGLTEVKFAEGSQLITLGYRVFYSCDNLEKVTIPASVQGIDSYAFAYCKNLKTVEIDPEGMITGIYNGAFYGCSALTEINIPDTVQEIGDYAFYDCGALQDVELSENSQLKGVFDYAFAYSGIDTFVMPAKLQDIGPHAFHGAVLNTLVCNDVLVEIGDYAFADCGLADTTSLVIPDTVQYIGYGMLENTTAVRELTVPFVGTTPENGLLVELYGETSNWDYNPYYLEKLTITQMSAIRDGAFYGWGSLREIVLPEHLLSIGESAFMLSGIRSIEIPDGVTVLPRHAFAECTSLTSVVLPRNLKTIADRVFPNCSKLQSVDLPATVSYIGEWAFSGCAAMTAIRVAEGNRHFVSVDGILYTADLSKIVAVPGQISGTIRIPEGFTKVDDGLFRQCTKITEVMFPETLKTIGNSAFMGCTGLTEITFPASLESVGNSAFEECRNLRKVNYSDTPITLGHGCFCGTGFETVVLPESVVSYGTGLFSDCWNLTSATILSKHTDLGGMFTACSDLESFTLPEDVAYTSLGGFNHCNRLKEVRIPDSVTEMSSFNYCTSLEYVYIGAGVEKIYADFGNCRSLQCVEVSPDNPNYMTVDGMILSKDGKTLVFGPAGLTGHVTIPDGVETVWSSAFSSCAKIEAVTLPDSVTEIGTYAFSDCSALEELHVGSNIQEIGEGAFSNTGYAKNPKNIDPDSRILYVGPYAISCVYGETAPPESITIREGTTMVANLQLPYGVRQVFLPDSVKVLGGGALRCDTVQLIHLGNGVETVNWAVVDSAAKSLWFPESVRYNDSINNVINGGEELEYLYMGNIWVDQDNSTLDILGYGCHLKTLSIPYKKGVQWQGTFGCQVDELIINTTDGMDRDFLWGLPEETKVYCYVDESAGWPTEWEFRSTAYYKDEWHLATFFLKDTMIVMDPIVNGEVVQAPAAALVEEYLLPGETFLGWDINGDGKVDDIPAVLKADLNAEAVLGIPVSSIALSETEVTMEELEETTLTVSYKPAYHNGAESILWSSSNESVAVVDENGKITGVGAGEATITATLKQNPAVTADCTVTVTPLQPGIRLEETAGLLQLGESKQLVHYFVGMDTIPEAVIWRSSDESVATVDQNGTITAVGPGSAEITVEAGEYSAVYQLRVCVPMERVTIQQVPESLNVGQTAALSVAFQPANTTDDRSVVWSSSNRNIATVSSNGVVTAVAPGAVTITVRTTTGLTASHTMTVYAPIQWIKLNTTVGTMRIDRTKPLEVIYEPANTTDDKTAVWSTSDATVATVDENGVVTAKKAGTAVITATVGQHTATYTVTVVGLKDKDTGVIVVNADDTPMEDNVSLYVVAIGTEEAQENYGSLLAQIEATLDDGSGRLPVMDVYDISLFQNGTTVQPTTDVDVEIPTMQDVDGTSFVVYRVEPDGTITDMTAQVQDQIVSFRTEHFSTYVVAARSLTSYPTAISLNKTALQLCPGKQATLKVTIQPDTAENRELVWHSSDTSVVRVDNGAVTAVAAGTAEVSVTTANGLRVVCRVTVAHTITTVPGEEATCITDGMSEGKLCSVCGEWTVKQQVIPAKGHTEVIDKAVAPTCTATGLTEGKHCSVCNSVLVKQEIVPAKGHKGENGTCGVCGAALITITKQPTDVVAKNGKTAKVTVVAEGEGLKYAWYWASAGSEDFQLTTSFKTNSYSITMNESRSGRQVYCEITDKYGNTVKTDVATLSLPQPPVIRVQPVASYAKKGEEVKVSLEAEGEGLTYKWYWAKAGSSKYTLTKTFTGPEYKIEMNDSRAGRKVYCVVTNQYGQSVKSKTVTLRMELELVKDITDATAPSGKKASVTVKANGQGLKYEWYYSDDNGENFKLTTSFKTATYSLAMNEARDGRQVFCRITDKYGNMVETSKATLGMVPPPEIVVQPTYTYAPKGERAAVSLVAEGEGLTYKWYYANAGSSKYTLTKTFTGPEYYVDMTDARAGRKVYCVVTDKYGVSVKSNTATLRMELEITEDLKDVTVANGKKASVTVKANGQGLKYEWYYSDDGENFQLTTSFKTATYSITMNEARDGRQVFCRITDKYGNKLETSKVTLGMK